MKEARRKEIALRLVEARIIEEGFPGANGYKKDIHDSSVATEIDGAELEEFYHSCLLKLINELSLKRSR